MRTQDSAAGRAARTYAGKGVVVRAIGTAYAARRATTTLREAERVLAALDQVAHPPGQAAAPPVHIVLTDPIAPLLGMAGAPVAIPGGDQNQIVRVVQPDAPDEPLALAVTRVRLAHWYGAAVAAVPLFAAGIAGVAAARAGLGPAPRDADAAVRAAITAGRPVSVFDLLAPAPAGAAAPAEGASVDPAPAPFAAQVATSFMSFLLDTFGAEALPTFLAAYDPARRDQAAQAAYQRPLGRLEESWLAAVARPPGHGRVLRLFFAQLGPLLRPYWRRELEVAVYMLAGITYGLALPLASKILVDSILPHGVVSDLLVFILVLLGIYLLNIGVEMRRAYVSNWVDQHILVDLQERMFAHLQRLGHDFYGDARVGDLMLRLEGDLATVQGAMAQVVGVGAQMGLSALAAAVTLLVLSPLLGALVLLIVPLFGAGYLLLRRRLEQASLQHQELAGALQSTVQENLTAHALIKAFGAEGVATRTYHANLLALLRAGLRLVVLGTIFEGSLALVVTVAEILVLGLGGYFVLQDQMTVGTLLAFIGLLPTLFVPVASLSGVGQAVELATGSLERVQELLDAPIAVADRPGAGPLPPLREAIRLEGVTFGYDPGEPVLHDVDLTIPAGIHVAIVGPSGSGKSTIVNLLLRFWDPDSGRVLFDGQDARDVTVASLRGQIGPVFQDTFVFDTTLRANIGLARPDASDAAIAAAAAAARLDDYVAGLPAGYDTLLGERGVRMSGGQRQRLGIARALLRDPRILIFDEATSALDSQTEREILDTLATLLPGRTAITITHRLAVAATADRICVLQAGRLVEQGTHAELLRAGGVYRALHDAQVTHEAPTGGAGRAGAVAAVQAMPLFAALDPPALAALAGSLVREHYGPGTDIVREGEPGDRLYLIGRGQVEVAVGQGPARRVIDHLADGDYFGELALLAGAPRAATVRATAPTDLYSLDQADFAAVLAREPAIAAAVESVVARRRAAVAAATSAEC